MIYKLFGFFKTVLPSLSKHLSRFVEQLITKRERCFDRLGKTAKK